MEEKKPVAALFDGAQIRGVIFDMDGLMFDTETMFLKVLPEIGMANGYDILRRQPGP